MIVRGSSDIYLLLHTQLPVASVTEPLCSACWTRLLLLASYILRCCKPLLRRPACRHFVHVRVACTLGSFCQRKCRGTGPPQD